MLIDILSGELSEDDEAAIRARCANGEMLIRSEFNMKMGYQVDYLLTPDEIAALPSPPAPSAPSEPGSPNVIE